MKNLIESIKKINSTIAEYLNLKSVVFKIITGFLLSVGLIGGGIFALAFMGPDHLPVDPADPAAPAADEGFIINTINLITSDLFDVSNKIDDAKDILDKASNTLAVLGSPDDIYPTDGSQPTMMAKLNRIIGESNGINGEADGILGYIGSSINTYMGNLGGMAGAAKICSDQYGVGARMCNCEDVSESSGLWCYIGDYSYNCMNYTYQFIDTCGSGPCGMTPIGQSTCNLSRKIACCGKLSYNNTAAKPYAPQNLTAIQTANSPYVTLKWNDISNNETGFEISRNGAVICTLGPNTEQADHNNCSALGTHSYNTVYIYNVKAYNTAGGSGAATVQLTTSACVADSDGSNILTDRDEDCDSVVDNLRKVGSMIPSVINNYYKNITTASPGDIWDCSRGYAVEEDIRVEVYSIRSIFRINAYSDPSCNTGISAAYNGKSYLYLYAVDAGSYTVKSSGELTDGTAVYANGTYFFDNTCHEMENNPGVYYKSSSYTYGWDDWFGTIKPQIYNCYSIGYNYY